MPVTRTITLDDLTPTEMAYLFAEMDGVEQAEFFATIWMIAKAWRGAGWCQQSSAIVRVSSNDAIQTIRTLASHLPADDLAWIAAAGAES